MTHGHLCQRPVFSVGVSQHMHKTINLWKIELNWSSKLRDSNGRNIHPCHTELCAFRCLISRRHAWGHEIKFKYFSGKLLLSRKLRYFREYCSLNSLFFFLHKKGFFLNCHKSFKIRLFHLLYFGALPLYERAHAYVVLEGESIFVM